MSSERTAMVTGAGIRVGRAIALALAEAGYDLVLHANRSVDSLAEVAAQIRERGRQVTELVADLSDPAAVDGLAARALAAAPRLSVLVHNAGLYRSIPFDRVSRDDYRLMQAVNLEAPYFLSQALLPALRAASPALIVHLADIAADRVETPYSHYTVSKAGLVALTRSLAVELAPEIRVNAVAPGTVAFPPDFSDEQRAAILARIPSGRVGEPEDIARTVVFLADRASYITGQVIAVDGGRSAQL